jgi:hypothetical protein
LTLSQLFYNTKEARSSKELDLGVQMACQVRSADVLRKENK